MKTGYHHGNLRQDLLLAGAALVRRSGMAALGAREVAREVGVTPTAIYRHFPDLDHLRADVSQYAREELATSMMGARDAVVARTAGTRARRRFEATGRAYIRFAQTEPGWFDAAFAHCTTTPERPDDPNAWDVLNSSLDELVAAGLLDPRRRHDAPVITWTTIHGFASLVALGAIPEEAATDDDVILKAVQRALGMA